MAKGLFLTVPKPAIGGGEEHNHQIAKHLVELGEEILVVTPHYPGDTEFDKDCGYSVIRVDTRGGISGKGKNWWKLYRRPIYGFNVIKTMLEFKPDYVVVGSAFKGLRMLASGIVSNLAGIPLFVFVNHDEFTRATPYSPFTNLIFRSANLICISNYTRSLVLENGIPDLRTHVVFCGVDTTEIRLWQESNQDAWLPREVSDFRGKMILTVCRLTRHKGIDRLIQSMPRVLSSVPEARLVIVGDGPERGYLENLARESPVRNHINFLGRLRDDEKFACYQKCDVFVMPSRTTLGRAREGFGIVFLEANAFGKPVIGGNSGGIPDAIVHNETGLLVDPNSTKDISSAIIRLLLNPREAYRMGENGRRRVQGELNWSSIATQVRDLIHENADTSSAPRR